MVWLDQFLTWVVDSSWAESSNRQHKPNLSSHGGTDSSMFVGGDCRKLVGLLALPSIYVNGLCFTSPVHTAPQCIDANCSLNACGEWATIFIPNNFSLVQLQLKSCLIFYWHGSPEHNLETLPSFYSILLLFRITCLILQNHYQFP